MSASMTQSRNVEDLISVQGLVKDLVKRDQQTAQFLHLRNENVLQPRIDQTLSLQLKKLWVVVL